MTTEDTEKKRPRGIYLLPNLFTTGCLFAGFFSIVAAMGGRFEAAVVAVFIAMILDGLDGRVARLTNTQTEFGAQYDSLADMISFGLAPALVMYAWALNSMGKLGWLAAFIYAAAAALRLARFNTQVGIADKRYFQGLASPAAAAVIVGAVWIGVDYGQQGIDWRIPAFLLTLLTGILMVSNVRYRSFKDVNLKGRVRFVTLLIVVFVFVFISIDPPQVLFGLFFSYALSGPVLTLITLRKRKAQRLQHSSDTGMAEKLEEDLEEHNTSPDNTPSDGTPPKYMGEEEHKDSDTKTS